MNAILEMELQRIETIMEDIEDVENLDKSEHERFKIRDLDSANWVLRKLAAIENKKKEIESLAQKEITPYELEISRIREWKDTELKSFDRSINFFHFLLEEYYRDEKVKDSKFKLSTPYGKVTSRKAQDKWTYEDKVILSSLKKAELNQFIKIKEDVNRADLKKEVSIIENAITVDGVFEETVKEFDDKYVGLETGVIYDKKEFEENSHYEFHKQLIVFGEKIIEGIKVVEQPDSITIKVEG